jgi:hypothetical protein
MPFVCILVDLVFSCGIMHVFYQFPSMLHLFPVIQYRTYCNVLGFLYSRWNFIALQKSIHHS